MPANIMNNKIDRPIAAALNMDMKDTWRSVLGIDIIIPISMTMTEKTTVPIVLKPC